ncbi:MAG TPA: outer membrane beta-barrel protein [Polyangiaceae bacterium]|nr:outer membrane beta-barrel protein [Polyangiaceae bacterium]
MKALIQLATFTLASSLSSLALAEEPTPSRIVGTAPSQALEISVSGGFAQGFGDVSKTTRISDFARDGASLQLGLGYRLSPRFMLGVYAEGAGYEHGALNSKETDSVGAAAGIQVQYHFAPFQRVDPWLSAGVGWRGYWETEDDSVKRSLQGVDSLRLQAGVDCRLTPQIALSPVLGVSIAKFLAEKQPGQSDFHEIDSPRSNVFLFAGAMGRFDLGGLSYRNPTQVASR